MILPLKILWDDSTIENIMGWSCEPEKYCGMILSLKNLWDDLEKLLVELVPVICFFIVQSITSSAGKSIAYCHG